MKEFKKYFGKKLNEKVPDKKIKVLCIKTYFSMGIHFMKGNTYNAYLIDDKFDYAKIQDGDDHVQITKVNFNEHFEIE